MSNFIKKIRTQSGDAQIDYEALANLPTSDKTLTQEGSFADAKEVGDRLSKLSDEESDPTVPAWAKQPNKPSYTAQEVGALPVGTKIPSRTSDLQNDSGFLTEHQDLSGYALKSEVPKSASDVGADASGTAENKVSEHNASDTAHNDIRLLIQNLINTVTTLLDSNDETLDQTSEIVAYVKSNKSLIDAITTSKVSVTDIIDNLTTNVANKPLSASQGVALKGLIDALQTELNGVEIPVKLPNPNSLKITYGGQEYNYDGSEAKEIVIDSASIDEDELNTMLQEVLV